MIGGVRTAAVMLALVVGGGAVRAEIIDRVLAVVNGAVILQSDSRGATRLGLIQIPPGTPAGLEANRAALDRLIERRLVLVEVNRSATPNPADVVVDAGMIEVRSRFTSDEEFERALAEAGLALDQVRGFIRDDLRMAAYLQQRFGATQRPSDTEVLEYYRDNPDRFTRNGALRPFNDVEADARQLVIETRRSALIRDWIAGLRRRADITIPAVVRR
jgi:hypothetical protein